MATRREMDFPMRSHPAGHRAQWLWRRLIRVQEQERQRIAQDLHDQLGERLTTLRIKLECLRGNDRGIDVDKRIEELLALTDQIDRELDLVTWHLTPAPVDVCGLMPALDTLMRDWSEVHQIRAEFRAVGFEGCSISRIENCVYRICQEALNNISKHARATRVAVLLERRGEEIILIVEDNGCGLRPHDPPDTTRHSMGIIGIRQRAAAIGGSVEIETAPHSGTTIYVKFPNAFVRAS